MMHVFDEVIAGLGVDAPPIGWWLLAEECRRADELKRAKEQVVVERG